MGCPSKPLFDAAIRGDQASLNALLERHLPGLETYIGLRSGSLILSRESVGDLSQSVCRELLQELDRFVFDTEGAFRLWLFRAAERKIQDRGRYWRRGKRDVALELHGVADDEPDWLALAECPADRTPSRDAAAREELEHLARSFGQLPEDYREVIVLSRVVGLSHAEIATNMHRTEGAVRKLLHRALAKLSTVVSVANRPCFPRSDR